MAQAKNDMPYIKIKDIYIKKAKINFFYYDKTEEVIYIGVDGNIITVELDSDVDNIERILLQLDNLIKYKEIY